jgi:hypothetical protein
LQSPAAKKGPPARAGQGTFSGYSQGKAGGDDSECSNVSFDIRCESHHVFGLNRVLQVWSYRTLVYQLRLRNQGRRDGQTDLYEERQKEVLVSLPSLSVNSTTYEKTLKRHFNTHSLNIRFRARSCNAVFLPCIIYPATLTYVQPIIMNTLFAIHLFNLFLVIARQLGGCHSCLQSEMSKSTADLS